MILHAQNEILIVAKTGTEGRLSDACTSVNAGICAIRTVHRGKGLDQTVNRISKMNLDKFGTERAA